MQVREVMTPQPRTIGQEVPVSKAMALMRAENIRHLPVVEGDELVGLVSERDIFLLLSLNNIDADRETVQEAMTEVPYTVSPTASLAAVAREMAERKYGSVVVVERGQVVGVLTTVDALRRLADLLDGRSPVSEERGTAQYDGDA